MAKIEDISGGLQDSRVNGEPGIRGDGGNAGRGGAGGGVGSLPGSGGRQKKANRAGAAASQAAGEGSIKSLHESLQISLELIATGEKHALANTSTIADMSEWLSNLEQKQVVGQNASLYSAYCSSSTECTATTCYGDGTKRIFLRINPRAPLPAHDLFSGATDKHPPGRDDGGNHYGRSYPCRRCGGWRLHPRIQVRFVVHQSIAFDTAMTVRFMWRCNQPSTRTAYELGFGLRVVFFPRPLLFRYIIKTKVQRLSPTSTGGTYCPRHRASKHSNVAPLVK